MSTLDDRKLRSNSWWIIFICKLHRFCQLRWSNCSPANVGGLKCSEIWRTQRKICWFVLVHTHTHTHVHCVVPLVHAGYDPVTSPLGGAVVHHQTIVSTDKQRSKKVSVLHSIHKQPKKIHSRENTTKDALTQRTELQVVIVCSFLEDRKWGTKQGDVSQSQTFKIYLSPKNKENFPKPITQN